MCNLINTHTHTVKSPYVCVCVFFPFILDIQYVERTSRVRRIQPFLSLVDREAEFCVLTI